MNDLVSTDKLSEHLKESHARELLSLLFPDTYSTRWNVEVTTSGISYCDGAHGKNEACVPASLPISDQALGRYRHKKRGSHYDAVAIATLQVEPGVVLMDGDKLVVYLGVEDPDWWARQQHEFHDGRFELVKTEDLTIHTEFEAPSAILDKHPSHDTRISIDASTYDEICKNCGYTDVAGAGWGKLSEPCPKVPPMVEPDESQSAFDGIKAGLEDAIAFSQGDTSRGRIIDGFDLTDARVLVINNKQKETPPVSIQDKVAEAMAVFNALSPEDKIKHMQAQRESFARSMTTPCEHGVLDFEQCGECRSPKHTTPIIQAIYGYMDAMGVPRSEFDPEFVVKMVSAMMVSFHKYGYVKDVYPIKFDATSDVRERMKKYREGGNKNFLVDAANFAMIESMHSQPRFNAVWGTNDATDSPGRSAISGRRLVQEDNDGNRIMGETILRDQE